MANFKSEAVTLNAPAETVWEKLSDLGKLKEMLANLPADQIPADKRDIFDNMDITSERITLPGGPTGPITLRKSGSNPYSLIRLEGEGTPVGMSLMMHIVPLNEFQSEATVEIDIKVPMMVVPMIKGPLQKIVDQFAQVLKSIPMA